MLKFWNKNINYYISFKINCFHFKMKTVYFKIDGRFGNNLFQYFAAEIICKIYNFENVKYVKDFKHYCYVIYNQNFINICDKYIKD